MTQETIDALFKLAGEIQNLASGVMLITGVRTTVEVCDAAEQLKQALNKERATCQN